MGSRERKMNRMMRRTKEEELIRIQEFARELKKGAW
jgi:hypothetical protein